MTFLDLYGDELDRELGSADRAQLFTVARRKAAINAAQREWIERTECLQRQVSITPLLDDTGEYDLETEIADFGVVAKQGPTIEIVPAIGDTRYIEGDDFPQTSVERLNAEEPGWRGTPSAEPFTWYLRKDGGAINVGLHPRPKVAVGDTWSLLVPVVIYPTDLSADADEPFTVSGNPVRSLRFYHRALPHFAAHDLEKLRKDLERASVQGQLFDSYVQRYLASQTPKRGQLVRYAVDYRARARGRGVRVLDPRVWP